MVCKICGIGNCITSFHSLVEQEQHDKYAKMDDRELIAECIDKDYKLEDIKGQVEELEKWRDRAFEAHPNIDLDMEVILDT